jgi:biopolymer transport protein ExbD
MKIKRKKRNWGAETVAASDLAFLLIIYFLVIAGFNINIGFLLELPQKGSVIYVPETELLLFEIDEGGTIFFKGQRYNIVQAEGEIASALAAQPNLALLLLVEASAPWQSVVAFVELAQKLRVDSFSFNLREFS